MLYKGYNTSRVGGFVFVRESEICRGCVERESLGFLGFLRFVKKESEVLASSMFFENVVGCQIRQA